MVAPLRRRHTDVLTRPIANIPSAELVTRKPADWDNDTTVVEAPAAAARSKRTRIAIIRDEAPATPPAFLNDAITYACPCNEGNACLRCDAGTAVAAVTLATVNIGSITYDRGAEDEERIAEALELVDDEHRERLEWLLRNGPAEDSDTIVAEVTAPISLAAIDRNSDVAPMSLIDCLRESLRVAAQESRADFRTKTLAMAQLGPGGGK